MEAGYRARQRAERQAGREGQLTEAGVATVTTNHRPQTLKFATDHPAAVPTAYPPLHRA